MKTSLRKRLFAWIMKLGEATNRKLYGSYKKPLLQDLKGTVLEIGPGTGINFNYLPTAITWMGVEPNVAFHEVLLAKAKEKGIAATLLAGDATHIPLLDNSVDTVFITLVLCSVNSVDKAIAEMKRVLKPGGKLIFIEHVAAPKASYLRLIQDMLNPINRMIADGCNCNKETWKYIELGGFRDVKLEHRRVKGSLPLHAPHIMGFAVK